VHWVQPELVAEVKFLACTEDNLLRQVVYEGLREDDISKRPVEKSGLTFAPARLRMALIVRIHRLGTSALLKSVDPRRIPRSAK
jgi:hypothetical protein